MLLILDAVKLALIAVFALIPNAINIIRKNSSNKAVVVLAKWYPR